MQADVLKTLRDIEGVEGSFFASSDGQLVARDLPAVFSDVVLAEAGTRMGLLAEALGPETPCDWVLLKFAEHQLFLKVVSSSYLAIIAARGTNLPALKMAASLVAKRLRSIEPSALPAPSAPAPPVEPISVAPPVSEPPPTVASVPNPHRRNVAPPEARSLAPASSGAAKTRIFRGRRIDG